MSLTDLHICEPCVTKSGSEESPCDCPPEYICQYICGEDYSVSTPISWQHFPRSTSSRSRCDDSSEEVLKSISSTLTPGVKKSEEESTVPSSTEYPISKSFAQLKALHYLEIRHVFDFLNFLIGHLVCNEPEDPVSFLVDILGKCLKFRDSFGEPPLLFTHAHIKSLYSAFDPFERGHITQDQYKEAMKTLGLANGITPYNHEPELTDDGYVEESNFVFEAERCLIENLRQMLRLPKIWEENRRLWLRKKKKLKGLPPPEESEMFGEDDDKYCQCSEAVTLHNVICHCVTPAKMEHEPEQMFLGDCV